jgi:hypothetical protein
MAVAFFTLAAGDFLLPLAPIPFPANHNCGSEHRRWLHCMETAEFEYNQYIRYSIKI